MIIDFSGRPSWYLGSLAGAQDDNALLGHGGEEEVEIR